MLGLFMKYRTIVADPPWPIGQFPPGEHERAHGVTAVHATPYSTMTLAEISRLRVGDLADRSAHLYLWTITDHLERSFQIARDWGFDPSAVLVWCKTEVPGGLGGTFPANVEFIVFATRRVGGDRVLTLTSQLADRADELGIKRADVDAELGTSDMGSWWLSRLAHRCACPTNDQWPALRSLLELDGRDDLDQLVREINAEKGEATAIGRGVTRWFQWPRRKHSEKPEAFLDLVEQVSPGPYLELFARRQRLGWDTWGNEALNHVEMGA